MKYFFFLCCLLLASCASTRHTTRSTPDVPFLTVPLSTADSTHQLPTGQAALTPRVSDTSSVATKRTLREWFFGSAGRRTTATQSLGSGKTKIKARTVVVNQVTGNQTNQTQTVAKKAQANNGSGTSNAVGKSQGPTVAGAGAAKDQSKAGNASDVTGNGNAPHLENTEPPKPTFLQTLFGSTLKVLLWIVALALLIGYGWYRTKKAEGQTLLAFFTSKLPGRSTS